MSDPLLDELLSKPVGTVTARKGTTDYTRSIEQTGSTLHVEISGPEGEVTEGTAADYLREEGLDPAHWRVTGFRKGKWGDPDKPMESCRFTFAPASLDAEERPSIDELVAVIDKFDPQPPALTGGQWGLLVLIGDMQFGKIDGDGVEGTLRRTLQCIEDAGTLLDIYRARFDIGHVHVAWLGDHIEGFNSQGGANTWRTQLSLNEQIRLTRRVMLYALITFAPKVSRLTMAAVPGNHGEAVRLMGKGLTRYDDSHDTESLIAVSEAATLAGSRFEHVDFYVPETDELTVVVNVAGTTVAHAHGHQFTPGKHFEWWKGQAFNPQSALRDAELLATGHLHHQMVEEDGDRLFVQVPSMESESTWYKHRKGTSGSPGLLVALTKDGVTPIIEKVRGEKYV